MKEYAVVVDNVTMRFNLAKEKTDSLKEYVIKLFKRQLHFDEFFALKNVSFSIEKGDAFAIIGANGSGKSTLLKVISGIYSPSMGKVCVNGSIAPLIELGAGFDMELTARENVFLNCTVLGYSRAYVREHLDEIIDFAEVREFVDVPLKNYSSGMVARLGFSIATMVRPEILIVDEVLSVGDQNFRKKCEDRITDMLQNGTTLIFVSHMMDQVRKLCRHAIWLSKGSVMIKGDIDEVCNAYEAAAK